MSEAPKNRYPGWPDQRGWISIAMFALSWRLVEIINANPLLLANASFMQVVTLIIGSGGLLLILAFHFAASKGASEANARADAANDRLDAANKEEKK